MHDVVPAAIFKAVSRTITDALNQAIELQLAFSGSFRYTFAGTIKVRATFSDAIIRTFADTFSRLSESIVFTMVETFSDTTSRLFASIGSTFVGTFTYTIDFQ
jgi:hypothetical protein